METTPRTMEDARHLLVMLSEATDSACKAVEREDFEEASRLLAERVSLMNRIRTLQEGAASEEGAAAAAPIIGQNERLLGAIQTTRREILRKLEEAQKRKAYAAYRR